MICTKKAGSRGANGKRSCGSDDEEDGWIMALTVWTYDWVPEGPRGFVRDLRLRWALQEAGLSYSVRSTPFDDRGSEHLKRQPFGQIGRASCGERGCPYVWI